MLKSKVILEKIIGEYPGRLELNHDTPTFIVKEMLNHFLAYILQIEENAKPKNEAESDKPLEGEPPIDESTMPPEQPKSE